MNTPSPGKIHLPRGFRFAALAAGLKASGRPDLAFVEADPGTTAAAMFTSNRVVAAPILVGRKSLAAARGRLRALIVNSGNANCATGKTGLQSCERVCREVGRLLNVNHAEVFPSSTGIIGVPLPIEKILPNLPVLIAARASTQDAMLQFAQAIMTTDTRPKLASARFRAAKNDAVVSGVAKGAGMIHPQLATMLVYIFTDVAAAPNILKPALRSACDESFNCISIDGDTSTNDTVLLMASGQSGTRLADGKSRGKFEQALREVCQSLADQIVADGEGVKHVIRLNIEQAKNRNEALKIAKTIAHSLLVKTAWAGADSNWGRILAAAGRSGVRLDPGKINIFIGDQMVCRSGVGCAFDKSKAHQDLTQPRCDMRVQLGRGRGAVVFLTTDLTDEYVRINADYST